MSVSRDCPHFLDTPIISGTDEATDFKYGRYIHRVHLNKSKVHYRFGGKGSVGVSRTAECFKYLILSQERVKLGTSNFVRTFMAAIGTKDHYKFREK